VVGLFVLAASPACSMGSWRTVELGDALGVHGRRLEAQGDATLHGGATWSVAIAVRSGVDLPEVRALRFGVGTAARWSLQRTGASVGAWPDGLRVAGGTWRIDLAGGGGPFAHQVSVSGSSLLVRSEPCDATVCTYVFVEPDGHRDVFSFGIAADAPEVVALMRDIERGTTVFATVNLSVVLETGGSPPAGPWAVSVPLAPTGARAEFRP
jgi:hypothetical protein